MLEISIIKCYCYMLVLYTCSKYWNYQGFLTAWGDLLRFSVPGGTKEIAGLWFARERSVPRLTLWIRKLGKHNIKGITIVDPPPLLKVGAQDLPKIESLGGYQKFSQKGGITLKRRGIDVEMGGCHFFITLQFNFILCVCVCVFGRGGRRGE